MSQMGQGLRLAASDGPRGVVGSPRSRGQSGAGGGDGGRNLVHRHYRHGFSLCGSERGGVSLIWHESPEDSGLEHDAICTLELDFQEACWMVAVLCGFTQEVEIRFIPAAGKPGEHLVVKKEVRTAKVAWHAADLVYGVTLDSKAIFDCFRICQQSASAFGIGGNVYVEYIRLAALLFEPSDPRPGSPRGRG